MNSDFINETVDTTQHDLDYWRMKNMSTCEYESKMGVSAWSEMDKITDAKDND